MEYHERMISETVAIIEATYCEQSYCWIQNYQNRQKPHPIIKRWGTGQGWLETVGYVNNLPVCVSLMFIEIDNGKQLCFYHPTSRMVDWQMVEDFIAETFPNLKSTDAANFHI